MSMTCAVLDQSLLIPFVQAGHLAGRTYRGVFHNAQRCPHCAYVRFPSPPPAILDEYYEIEYPQGSASWYNAEGDYAPWKVGPRSERIIEICAKFGIERGATVHEFGCAFGGTVHALRSAGFEASGTELNRLAVEGGRARGNAHIHAESALSYLAAQAAPVDCVYSYHALEHFSDPFTFLAEIARLISDNGIIISVLPSSTAAWAMVHGHMRYMWFGYPEHLHLFSPASALSLADKSGCVLLDIQGREFGMEPDLTPFALESESDTARLLKTADRTLLGEELIAVFARKESTIAQKFASQADIASTRARAFGTFERQAMLFNEATLVDPWSASRLEQQKSVKS